MIAALVEGGAIKPAYALDADQIQPASLDLRLGEIAYRVRASFLPGRTTVAQRVEGLKLHEIALANGAVLETGCVYIVPLIESLALPEDISASANPKSSTGRLDVFTRVIADETRGFDRIGAGYHGPLYAEISPKTFPVLVRKGSRLSQIRFRHGNALLDAEAVRALHARERLVDDADADVSEGVAVGVDLSGLGPERLVGYRAKRHTAVVDVERRAGYDVAKPVMEHHPYGWIYLFAFIIVTTFMVLNLFIGVVVNAMQSESEKVEEVERVIVHEEAAPILAEVKGLRQEVAALRAEMAGRK